MHSLKSITCLCSVPGSWECQKPTVSLIALSKLGTKHVKKIAKLRRPSFSTHGCKPVRTSRCYLTCSHIIYACSYNRFIPEAHNFMVCPEVGVFLHAIPHRPHHWEQAAWLGTKVLVKAHRVLAAAVLLHATQVGRPEPNCCSFMAMIQPWWTTWLPEKNVKAYGNITHILWI